MLAGRAERLPPNGDSSLEGCECYQAYQCDKSDGLPKLYYLKVGMTRLNFDYFVCLDAALGYAMQILCADEEAHLLARYPALWGSQDTDYSGAAAADAGSSQRAHLSDSSPRPASAAVLHLARRSRAAGARQDSPLAQRCGWNGQSAPMPSRGKPRRPTVGKDRRRGR
ncbi:MAG TPA: hypothetical protein VJA21_27335 [Verrucomicrobiae bacterium]